MSPGFSAESATTVDQACAGALHMLCDTKKSRKAVWSRRLQVTVTGLTDVHRDKTECAREHMLGNGHAPPALARTGI